jgi:hypothetical protein
MRRPRDRLMHRLTGRLRERSAGPRRNVALWTGCSLALGASLGMAARIIAPLAEAEHSHDPHYHLGSILRCEDPETTCAKVLDGSASQEAVVAALRDVLDNPSHAAYDWDGTQFVTFRGQVMANECPQRSPQDATTGASGLLTPTALRCRPCAIGAEARGASHSLAATSAIGASASGGGP